ncbi:alpha-N-acetylgalactosaminidase, partial [Streptococcus pneumoniae]|nr:alpha-N-acetylgalactosaminidase [Streptococcus pneumoniae]
MEIENKNVRRNFFWGEGRFYTTDIVNKRAGVMIKNVSKEEFTITLENGIKLSSTHFSAIVREEGDTRIQVSFVCPSIRLRLIFESRDDVLSKQLVLESSTEVIKSVEVESFEFETEDNIFYPKRQDCIKEMANFSGYYVELGQPVYANSLFLGMEFPMSENKVDGRHYVSRYYLGTVVNQEKSLWSCI